MSNDQNDHYEGALLEAIRDDIKTILEGQQAMASVPGDIAQLKSDVFDIKNDIRTMKAVTKDHEKILKNHDKRLVRLETARA